MLDKIWRKGHPYQLLLKADDVTMGNSMERAQKLRTII